MTISIDLLVGSLEKFKYIFQDVMEKSSQGVDNFVAKLSKESINSLLVADIVIRINLSFIKELGCKRC